MQREEAPTYWAEICLAGDLSQAKHACREFCERGLCVTVTPTSYIYTGGEELGVIVRLINYPRFPMEADEIATTALELAEHLKVALYQDSVSVVLPDRTVWMSRRAPTQPHKREE
jgi:hypothetical protein